MFSTFLTKTRLKRLSVLDREIRYILGLFETFGTFSYFWGRFETFGTFLRLLGKLYCDVKSHVMLKVTLSKVPRRTTPTTIFKLVGPCEILSRSKTFATFDLRTCVEMIVQNSNSYKILYANLCYLNTLVRTTLEFT